MYNIIFGHPPKAQGDITLIRKGKTNHRCHRVTNVDIFFFFFFLRKKKKLEKKLNSFSLKISSCNPFPCRSTAAKAGTSWLQASVHSNCEEKKDIIFRFPATQIYISAVQRVAKNLWQSSFNIPLPFFIRPLPPRCPHISLQLTTSAINGFIKFSGSS